MVGKQVVKMPYSWKEIKTNASHCHVKFGTQQICHPYSLSLSLPPPPHTLLWLSFIHYRSHPLFRLFNPSIPANMDPGTRHGLMTGMCNQGVLTGVNDAEPQAAERIPPLHVKEGVKHTALGPLPTAPLRSKVVFLQN